MGEKYYKRRIIGEIVKYIDTPETIVIYGARQVGKTTLLKYLIQEHIPDAFYFDLELPNLLGLCNEGAERVYNYLLQKGAKGKIFLVVDEIQYLEDPSKFIKIMHDHYPQVKLIVSGSSTFEIRKKFKEALVGRTVNFEIYPLDFEEFLLFKGRSYTLKKENEEAINNELLPLAEEFIIYGGYPRIVLESNEEKKQTYLFQIINTYIRKDIRDLGNIRNISGFNRLVEALSQQSGQLLNVLELSNTFGINRDTVLQYLDLLENTFIIKRIRPFHKNLRTELSKNPKVFLLDTGMLHLLWFKEFPKAIMGNVFETFVFTELLKAGAEVWFWRTTNKQEIDFIVNNYAIEVKLNFQHANKRALAYFSERYGHKALIVGLKGKKDGKYPWELIKLALDSRNGGGKNA